ncbi:putative SOS response-associated peptidase YoqW [Collibacillus ludicampi]|uniref:Abasic site processing protein n=1 Tax=Collibacillus ludicampi TaxID=2771369 RepID=A0AAV4LKR2_9BACL|nr:SOS response-associated peptidase [Collibacillus ludicampi]GIM48485.1 putative SOS response-associated peptidase YoqW [Collibacillus ludicampi]
MCGRFTLTVPVESLIERFQVDQVPFDYQPRYNIAPGQLITAVVAHERKKRIGQLKWGLIPSWAKDEKIGYKMINAKAETVQEKPAFRNAFKKRRCIIPADGFYEWKRNEDGSKQPMRIMLKDKSIFGMAGLYETWIAPDGQKVHSCTIITTKPNGLMEQIHDRMPVILRREDEGIWLDREKADLELLQSLLEPYPEEEMFAYPVQPMVGNVKNDVPECIKSL